MTRVLSLHFVTLTARQALGQAQGQASTSFVLLGLGLEHGLGRIDVWQPEHNRVFTFERKRRNADPPRRLRTQVVHEALVRRHWPSVWPTPLWEVNCKHAAGHHGKRLVGCERKVHD